MNYRDDLALIAFYARNKEHLAAWEPARPPDFFTKDFWSNRLADWAKDWDAGVGAHFVSMGESTDEVLAVCSLTNIIRGPFQACNIGYAVSMELQGTGTMTELAEHVIDFAFMELGLNRVMANYLPRNKRSARLLGRLGFTEEGLARRYLRINGVWEDHILTSKVNPENR